MTQQERQTLAKKASYRYIQKQLRELTCMVAVLEERNRVLSMENDRLSARVSAQAATPPAEETKTPHYSYPESHILENPQPVQTLRYWIIKSRKTKEYFYLRCYKPHLICEPTWINDVLCVSGVTHATLVPEYLGMQMQIEYKGNFDLDFEVTVVENSVEQDESDVFFFDTLQVVSTDKNPEEFAARWMSMTKKYDKEGQPHYRYRESAIVDGKKKVVFEKKFPAPMMMPTLPMHNENNP